MNKIIHQQFLFDFITVTIEITTVNRFPGRLTEVNRRFSIGLHNISTSIPKSRGDIIGK